MGCCGYRCLHFAVLDRTLARYLESMRDIYAAIDLETMKELGETIIAARTRPEVRVIVLTGAISMTSRFRGT